jgi:tRNA (guanine37-N1)-methyltransferase
MFIKVFMRFHLLTLFPTLFDSFLHESLIGKAVKSKKIIVSRTNIRDFASPPHYKVDDHPYGGGAGMVLKPEPLVRAIRHCQYADPDTSVIFLSPKGDFFCQEMAEALSTLPSLTLVSSRYEGFDQRAVTLTGAREVSLGPYVTMGGEVGAMILVEAIARLLPGVMGNDDSGIDESFAKGDRSFKEAPQFTRPPEYEGALVPEVLLSGDHRRIAEWKKCSD